MNPDPMLRALPFWLLSALLVLGLGCTPRAPTSSSAVSVDSAEAAQDRADLSQPLKKDSDAATETVPSHPPLFEQVTSPSLETVIYRNGEERGVSSIVESLGGGIGIHDYDLDGVPDLIVAGGGAFAEADRVVGLDTHLLRGLGSGNFVNRAVQAGVASSRFYTHGVAIADYDNDGFPDLLLTGYGGLQLWRNQGDGTFIELASASGLNDDQWSSSAAWGDLNNDGNLDLYVCHYVDWSFANHPYCPGPQQGDREICSPRDFRSLTDVLYLSDAQGQFRDASNDWGLVEGGKGLGVVIGDMTQDGLPDIYVANDTTENFFYRNVAERLVEEAAVAGVAVDDEGIPNGSMGVELADINGDMRPDLWTANYERESFALYRNEGQGLFLHVSRASGITALGGLFVGFGSAALDADADGDLDIAIANGHVIKYPQFSQRTQVPLLLMNDNNRFSRCSFPGDHYFNRAHEGRGLARGDLDGDGHLDLVFGQVNAPITIMRSTLGAQQRSLSVRLIGRRSNREALGAQVVLKAEQGQRMLSLNGGGSYLSTNQPVLLFEIPEDWRPQRLTIVWPSGGRDELPLAAEDWLGASAHKLTIVESTNH